MRSGPALAAPIVFALGLGAGFEARAADWRRALEGPLTAGSVALLVEHASDPRVRERWSRALRDPRAPIRAAAARAIYASGSRTLPADLTQALTAETDIAAAREEIRAIVGLGVADGLQTALDAASRLGNHYAIVLAATGGDPGALARAGSIAVRSRDAALWSGALGVALASSAEIDPGLITASLHSEEPRLRRASLWYLVRSHARSGQLPETVREAVDSTPEAKAASDDPSGAFAVELLKRLQGRAAVERDEWTAALRDAKALELPFSLIDNPSIVRVLTPAERRSLGVRFTGDERWAERLALAGRDAGGQLPRPEPALSAIGGLPPGLAADTFSAAGCDLSTSPGWAAANIAYGGNGRRPRTVSVWETVTGSCLEAARALFVLALAPGHDRVPSPKGDLVVIPLDPEFLACLDARDEAAPAKAQPVGARSGGRIQEPKKLRDVKPVYPERAKQERIQGVVILEATISPTGCIRELRLLKSVHPSLDLAALLAVARWRYTPTLLDGAPVPVIMTVTVNFHLN